MKRPTLEDIRAEEGLPDDIYNEFMAASVGSLPRSRQEVRDSRLMNGHRHVRNLSHFIIWAGFVASVRAAGSVALYKKLPVAIALAAGEHKIEVEGIICDLLQLYTSVGEKHRTYPHRLTETKGVLTASVEAWSELRDKRRLISIVSDVALLPPELLAAYDLLIDIRETNPRHIQGGLRKFFGLNVSLEDAEVIARYPLHVIAAVFRPGRKLEQCLEILSAGSPSSRSSMVEDAKPALTLDTLKGMGAAEEWGRDLIQDVNDWKSGLIDWTDVDRGCLLSGEPGTGKTLFAQALANSAGVPLISSSFGRWQSAGHLGDMLRAMHTDFNLARAHAPCVWLVDEVDSVGDRGLDSSNAIYMRQVANAFLELLDGAESREGVVVIGCTNNPSHIDPAVLRPGRLDNHIHIEKPDATGREGILRFHLKDVLTEVRLDDIVRLSAGMSGADLEKLVRDAKRKARRQKRGLMVSDLMASLSSGDMSNVVNFSREVGHA